MNVTNITISGKKVTITLDSKIQKDDAISLQYIPGTNKVQDVWGNVAAAFLRILDTSNLAAAPVITSIEVGSVDNYSWVVVFDVAVTGVSLPSAFSVAGFTFNNFEQTGSNEVTFTSVEPAVYGGVYSGTFTKDEILQGLNDNYVKTQTVSVTNNVPLPVPTGLTAVWVDDFARLTVNDIIDASQVEWWESKNGGAYELVALTGLNIVTTDNYTWQNASMSFKCRGKMGAYYTDFCAPVTLSTPLVWKTNQTVLTTLRINALNITTGKSVTIDYGNGVTAVKSGNNSNIDYNYPATGTYFVKLTGDVDWIINLKILDQIKTFGSVTKWIIPSKINSDLSIRGCLFTGIFTGKALPASMWVCEVSNNGVPGITWDITNISMPSTLLELRGANQLLITGDIATVTFHAGLQYFYFTATGLGGSMTGKTIIASMTTLHCGQNNITGATPEIAASTGALVFYMGQSRLSSCGTTVFRKAMTYYDISSQKVAFPQAEIDKLLKNAADWYQTNAPTANCTYLMNGANMAAPSATGVADKLRLIGYYTAQSKTCTVTTS